MSRDYEQPLRHCDHCGIKNEGGRCIACHGPTRADDEPPIDYDRLREGRAEQTD